MEITFSYDLESETRRLLITLMHVARGFYIKNGFYVLPELLHKKFQKKVIVLPQLNYVSAGEMWTMYDNKPSKLCEYIFNPKLTKHVAKKLENVFENSQKKIDLKTFEKSVRKVINPALVAAHAALPYLRGKQITFNIHPTLFGSYGTFDYYDFVHSTKKELSLDLYLRIDQPPEVILELLASSLTRGVIEVNTQSSWRDTEAVSDFFVNYIFEAGRKHSGTIDSLAETDPQILRESLEYLQSLSAPTGKIIRFEPETKRLYVLDKQINHMLSPIEYTFLRLLVQNPNTCITFDRLTDEMYHSNADEKYSLWGIRKTAQRVREKLEKFGIPPGLIDSVKGEGFMIRV